MDLNVDKDGNSVYSFELKFVLPGGDIKYYHLCSREVEKEIQDADMDMWLRGCVYLFFFIPRTFQNTLKKNPKKKKKKRP